MKKNKTIISVIVLCYNAENYIKKCIDSILNQTFKDYELICVNDGSTDTTLEILKDYEKNNNNMKVITKKNEGGKNVTKTGLKYASGDYICAIDNDDYISPYYLEKLYNAIIDNNSDVSICGFQREDFVSGKVYSKEMNKNNKTVNLSDDYGVILEINTSMWNKMFKRDVFISLLDYKLDALAMGDMTLLAYMYSKIDKVTLISDILYFYQVREGSNISNIKESSLDSVYDNLIRIKRDFYNDKNNDIQEAFDAYAFLHLGVSIVYRIYKSDNDYKKLFRKNLEVLNKEFPLWKNSRYLKLNYVIKNKGRNFKLYVCRFFYKIHMFKLFIATYDFVTTKLKFDIKW